MDFEFNMLLTIQGEQSNILLDTPSHDDAQSYQVCLQKL